MKKYLGYILVWLLNALIIYLANSLYPAYFVLGTASLSPLWAAAVSGLLLTLFCRLGKLLAKKFSSKLKGRYPRFGYYWLVNAAGIWLIARFAPYTGLGITAFYWAIALGFVSSLFQWVLRQILKKLKFTK